MVQLVLLLILSLSVASATISTSAQWDIRTTGANTNGGFFVTGATGTDYSMQNGAQYSVTDAVTAVSTTITSATANFGTDIVGNGCYVSGGTAPVAAAHFEVTARTNSTTITVDRNGVVSTGVTLKCGGSLASIAGLDPGGTGNNEFSAPQSNNVWLKAGTYTQTARVIMNNSWGLMLKGYNTTHGDITLASQLTRPVITTATNSTHLIDISASGVGALFGIENVSFTNTAATRSFGINSAGAYSFLRIINCQFDGFSTALQGNFAIDWNWSWLELFSVEIKNSTGVGIYNSNNGNQTNQIALTFCWIHANASHGLDVSAEGLTVRDSIIASNGGSGVFSTSGVASLVAFGNAFVSNTGSGINVAALVTPVAGHLGLQFANNIFYGNGAYGATINSTDAVRVNFYNAYGANSTAARNNYSAGAGDVTLTADPFTSSGTGDYSLNATAGGGVALKQAGFPGLFPGGLSTGYISIGAVQPTSASSARQSSTASVY